MDFDPHIDQATLILFLCFHLIAIQIMLHLYRFFRSILSQSNHSNQDSKNNALTANPDFIFAKSITILFRYLLAVLYLGFVVYFIISAFSLFKNPTHDFDLYASQLFEIYTLQILTTITAYLLWNFSNQPMHWLIQKGYQLMVLDVLLETLYQTFSLPFNHWLQVMELNIICLLLLVIPLLFYLIFKTRSQKYRLTAL